MWARSTMKHAEKTTSSSHMKATSSSNHPTPVYRHFQPHRTPTEQFFECLKYLAYDAPKSQKAEHFDYLFKNEASAHFVKELMANVKAECILSMDEVEKYESLKKQGLLIYGIDLERVVKAKKTKENQQTENARREALKTQELERLISIKKSEVAVLKKQLQIIRNIEGQKQLSRISNQVFEVQLKRDSENLDVQLEVSWKRLMDKVEKLKAVKAELVSVRNLSFGQKKHHLMAYWNWDDFLRQEVAVNNQLQELFAEHFGRLALASEGYDEDMIDKEEEIRQFIEFHVANFERLRHCLIYEKWRRFKLNSRIIDEKVALEMFPVYLAKAVESLKRGINMKKLESNVDDRISDLIPTVAKDVAEMKEIIRDHVLRQVDLPFYRLLQSKNISQKRLNKFIVGIYRAIELQKVRIDVVRHLMSRQILHFTDIELALINFGRRITMVNFNKDPSQAGIMLSHEGRVLHNTYRELFPVEIFQSTAQTFNALTAINQKVFHNEAQTFKTATSRELDKITTYSNKLRKRQHQFMVLQKKFSTCEEIEQLQGEIQVKKRQFTFALKDHHTAVEKNITEQEKILEELNFLRLQEN